MVESIKIDYAIITQVKNQAPRIYDWIKYHNSQGFDTFIIFDDFSEDETEIEIKKAASELNVNIILNKTDGIGMNYYDIERSRNSNSYAFDNSFHKRLDRSYTNGNQIVKGMNPDAISVVIDVDEFLVTDREEKVTSVLKEIFEENSCEQILIYNFDIKHDYILEKGFLYRNKFKRWDYEEMENSEFGERSKCAVISKYLNSVTFVHLLINKQEGQGFITGEETFKCRDYSRLRMLHFRIPNQNCTINFAEDETLNKLFKNG